MTTITAVAKAAGVSIATVSRVINHLPQVAPETARVVQRAMADLGYRPVPKAGRSREGRAPAAQGWPAGVRHGSLAMLFPDHREVALKTALSGRLIHGLNDLLSSHGMTLQSTPFMPDGSLPSMIREPAVDGLVVRATIPVEAIARSVPPHLPVVWLMETVEPTLHRGDQVLEDTGAIGRLAARHFLDRGHRVVAAINSDPHHPCYARRIEAFRREVTQAGAQAVVIDGGRALTTAELPALAARLLEDPLRPTGLFLPLNDEGTVAVQRGLRERGGLDGRRLDQVACGNDRGLLGALNPEIYNIDIHAEDIAAAGGELILWRLMNPMAPRRRVLIEPSIAQVGPF